MSTNDPGNPIRYDSALETTASDDQASINGLISTLHKIFQVTLKTHGCPFRGVHAKSQGILKGELHVLPALPESLAQGLFAESATYPVVMRFSTIPGDVLPDEVSVPRGLAVKVVGVRGERLSGSENDRTQDLLMVNGPAFAAPNTRKFLQTLKLLAFTTEKFSGAKVLLSRLMRPINRVLGAFGIQSGLVTILGGHPARNVLAETYYSQGAILNGPYMAKFSLVPVSSELIALKDQEVPVSGRPNGLRDAVVAFFAEHSAEWELRMQLCRDLVRMPIEDPSVPWPEELSPFIAVARIKVPPQPAWNAAREQMVDRGMSFSPWHGLAAHRPLGAVMRARKPIYEKAAHWRANAIGAGEFKEPASLDMLE